MESKHFLNDIIVVLMTFSQNIFQFYLSIKLNIKRRKVKFHVRVSWFCSFELYLNVIIHETSNCCEKRIYRNKIIVIESNIDDILVFLIWRKVFCGDQSLFLVDLTPHYISVCSSYNPNTLVLRFGKQEKKKNIIKKKGKI